MCSDFGVVARTSGLGCVRKRRAFDVSPTTHTYIYNYRCSSSLPCVILIVDMDISSAYIDYSDISFDVTICLEFKHIILSRVSDIFF